MAPTAKPSVLSEYLISLVNTNKTALGVRRVYYCDQEYIPEQPSVCVEPARVVRELSGAPFRTNNEFAISVLVYGADVQGVEDAQRATDLVGESIVEVINAQGLPATQGGTSFGGLVIYGYVQQSDYGYVVKKDKLLRANRLMVYALSKTNLLET